MNEETSTKLNKRQQIAANLIGLGNRPREVAEKLSVSKETISRWQAQEEFQDEADRTTKALLLALLDERVALIDTCHIVIKDILLRDDTSNSVKGNIALKYLNAVGARANAYNFLTQRLSYLSERKMRRGGENNTERITDGYYDLINALKQG